MILVPLLLATASADPIVSAQLTACGFKETQITWRTDDQGTSRAMISPNGDLDTMPFSMIECLLRSPKQVREKIGFVSQPSRTLKAVE